MSDEEIEHDDYFDIYEAEEVIDDTFHIKVILNVLASWRGGFSDDNLMRTLIDRLPFQINHHTGWATKVKELEKAWLGTQSNDPITTTYVQYSKFLDSDIIGRVIVDPILDAYPELRDDFPISTTCQTLATLLDLNETETMLLQLSMEMKGLNFPFDVIYPRIAQVFDNKQQMLATMFGRSVSDIKEAVGGFLVKSGFIIQSTYPESFYVLSPTFEGSFDDRNIALDEIEDVIFPQSLSTDLTTEDYAHVESDLSRTEKIINNALLNKTPGTNVLLWGPAGTGKTELTIAMAKKNGWNLKSIGDISEADSGEKSRAQRLSNLKIAIKLFAGDSKSVLLFDEIEDLFKADNNAVFSKAFINRIIETTPVPIIWTTNSLIALGTPVLRRMTYNIHCTVPPKAARRVMWEKYATTYGVTLTDDTKTMLDNIDIPPALIRNTMKVTGSALSGDEVADQKDVREIVLSQDRLVNFGEKRKFDLTADRPDPFYDVSCVNTEHDLGSFTEQLKNAAPGFSLCLYGPPGTGKSKYGRYLASQLGKPVLFKRISDLQSMWVGECEKNIAKAFDEAKEEGKVLIIDEGDTFLRNREQAKNSWEVSQANEMLSQMEEHPEPFILTTNLMDDIDPAAMRRFTFKMKFDYMTPAQAARLFERYYSVKAPARIERNHMLTPGDIACVLKQVKILGIKDAEAIYKMIESEVALKPDYRKDIGF
jgi:SpoVK/Ycf46/Vps4 family AAA+-type ATPase